jgi:IMP dehydrogenase
MEIKESYSLEDVLLVPKYSTIKSRKNLDTSVNLHGRIYKHPIIPANMKTIVSKELAFANAQSGGLTILHRFDIFENQLNLATEMIHAFGSDSVIVSLGVQKEDYKNVPKFVDVGVTGFCIDIAHSDSELCVNMINFLRNEFSNLFVIAGNTATYDGAIRLWDAGADVVKVGIGASGICTTRIQTGNGVPQLTAIMETYKAKKDMEECWKNFPEKKFYFISDGGIKNSGDLAKCLCFADMVMAGGIFSGCEETPGHLIDIDGIKYKEYTGSSTYKTDHVEGVSALVKAKGSFSSILEFHLQGLKSAMSYQGVENLKDLKSNPQFTKISAAGIRESNVHDVDKILK